MNRVVEELQELHRDIDEMLDEKLKVIDRCMEEVKECPCGTGSCEVESEKFERIEKLYEELLKSGEVGKGLKMVQG